LEPIAAANDAGVVDEQRLVPRLDECRDGLLVGEFEPGYRDLGEAITRALMARAYELGFRRLILATTQPRAWDGPRQRPVEQ
jgi:hypothetical protein